uniref:TNFR-Cys domain-containing protein n=1 Tax=Latrodectus hesperus TaxID=256737 RepID=J7FZ48_LATHE|nr:hypothetical protein [Latrodectus hesperus]
MLSLFMFVLLVIAPFGGVTGTELCKDNEWYDDLVGACRKCQSCIEKSWEVAPCTAFMDTMCVDLAEIGRSLESNIKAGEKNLFSDQKRWHEMEGPAEDPADGKEDSVLEDLLHGWELWDVMLICIVVLLIFSCTLVLVLGSVKILKRNRRYDNNKLTRTRLFSRDRLNTTEYMNNLATLDRRLAIDEILEKKKRAIFEPQLLKENLYTDEVFVDISGLPRNFRNNDDYDEGDHKKCLLEMQGQQ